MSEADPDSQSPLPASTRDSILCAAVAEGDEATWAFIWARYLGSHNANEKLSLLTALACSRDVWILQRYLEMSLTEDGGVRKQDGYKIVVAVSNNLVGRFLAWDWLRSHWEELTTYYDPAVNVYVGRIISAVARDFNTEFLLSQLERFVTEHEEELGTATRDAGMVIESSRANVAWMEKHYQTVVDWISHQSQ